MREVLSRAERNGWSLMVASSGTNAVQLRYAGFWPRLFAHMVDTIVAIPIIALSWLGMLSRGVALAEAVPSFVVMAAYSVVMHARWGQTVGKMAARVKI